MTQRLTPFATRFSTRFAAPLLAAIALGAASQAIAAEPQALEISINGIGPAVDAKAFKRIKLLLGQAVYEGTVEYFDVYGHGIEGGFSACIEAGSFAPEGSFERLVRRLQQIKPDPATTAYDLTPVAHCQYPTAP